MTWEYQLKPATFTDLEDCVASLNRLGRDAAFQTRTARGPSRFSSDPWLTKINCPHASAGVLI
jgi:hypothetical protein